MARRKSKRTKEDVFLRRQCDFTDPQDRAAYYQSLRASRRNAMLDEMNPERICPGCKKKIMDRTRWVLVHRGGEKSVMCRACFHNSDVGAEVSSQDFRGFSDVFRVQRYSVIPSVMSYLRKSAGMSQTGFAEACGWSRTWQSKIESQVCTIPVWKARIIVEILEEHGVNLSDVPESLPGK